MQNKPSKRAPASSSGGERRQSTLQFYGDEFVFDTVSGMFYRMSPTATFLLRSLDAGAKASEVADLLQSRYDLDRATAARDAALFLNEIAALEPLSGLSR